MFRSLPAFYIRLVALYTAFRAKIRPTAYGLQFFFFQKGRDLLVVVLQHGAYDRVFGDILLQGLPPVAWAADLTLAVELEGKYPELLPLGKAGDYDGLA